MANELDGLLPRAAGLLRRPGTALLGITGAPAAGKSTLAAALVAALGPAACRLPMDGFHLANAELARLGRADRKGAPDTFDAAGYAATLRRIRAAGRAGTGVVYAPAFHREVEESYAAELAVDAATVRLVVTEGNYLLLAEGDWAPVAGLLDEVWYVEIDERLRRRRLIDRHIAYGRTPERARAWALGTDQANAEVVAATRHRADLVVRPGAAGAAG